ncbi:MAG: hypothetical protein A2068_04810 [Ignavibacteria bacterium GWB2_35_6b]|nr:MAG: hypothetical protein A2068_04810 [Ignavibacteria bacterium GWB2_35_6b]
MTDNIIENAVKVLPAAHFEKAGNELIAKLKSRRDLLFQFSNEYYNFVNKYLDIFCTDKEDSVFVNRINDLNTEVKVFSKEKKSSAGYGILYYHKIFSNEITKDIRIHLLDGDDKTFVTGDVEESPVVRFIGGEGKDEFEDSSIVNGYFLTFTPIPAAENRTRFYDSGNNTIFKTGPSSFVNRDEVPKPANQIEMYEPALRDRGHHWRLIPVLSFDSDNGLIFGLSPFVKKHNFRADPFEYKMSFTVMYATFPKSTSFGFSGEFPQYIKNAIVKLDAELTELRFTKYFGYGNNTVFSKALYNDDFYKLDQELFFVKPSVEFYLSEKIKSNLGVSYNYWESKLSNKILINNFPYENSGLGNIKVIGLHSEFEYNSLDNQNEPAEGFQINSKLTYYPKVWQVDRSFVKGSFDAKTYFTTNSFSNVTLALRAGAAKIWGHYPFFEGVFLGGPDNLRGYNRDRFAGDAYLFGKAELRTYLTEVKIILKGKLGFHLFGESGRVFAQGEDSNKWHPSYGGGLWLSYLNSELVGAAYIAGSPEGLQFYLNVGFGF